METIDTETYATMTTCDATAGVVHAEYDNANCDETPVKKFEFDWGACVKSPDGKNYMQVTGAAAMKAAAVALVAFAGSQFWDFFSRSRCN